MPRSKTQTLAREKTENGVAQPLKGHVQRTTGSRRKTVRARLGMVSLSGSLPSRSCTGDRKLFPRAHYQW